MHALPKLASALAVALVVGLASKPSAAVDALVGVEPGAAFAVDGPQKDFGVGAAVLGRGAVSLADVLDFEISGGYVGFPGASNGTSPGVGLFGGGLRLHGSGKASTFVPWLDGQAFFARTSSLNRGAITAGVGLAIALDEKRSVYVGPYARYVHVFQGDAPGFDTTDGKFMALGAALEWGASRLGPPPDSDGDGIPDVDDKCPTVAGPAASQGCPVADSDGDGVKDDVDKCPKVPGAADNAGCPYGDADNDGVLDNVDKCPKVPGAADNAGCPYGDIDNDGVNDKLDRCPKEPGPAATHGCPDPDGDGLVPPEDKCPEKAGTPENNGCPVYKAIKVTAKKIELSQKVFFAFGKAVIQEKSFGLLDEVAQALRDYPQLKVRVEGHTDNVGDAAKNLKLSDDRARSVRDYLVGKGIGADRIDAKGFGDTSPLDSNATTDGREKNRRVEFVVVGGEAAAQEEKK